MSATREEQKSSHSNPNFAVALLGCLQPLGCGADTPALGASRITDVYVNISVHMQLSLGAHRRSVPGPPRTAEPEGLESLT